MKTIMAFVVAAVSTTYGVPALSAGAANAVVSQQFASVSVGHRVAADSPEARRAAKLLPIVARHFNLSESRVFDMIDVGRHQAVEDGVDFDMLAVLEALPSMDPYEKSNANQLANIIALYDADRAEGMSHTDAIIGIHDLLRDIK